MKFKSPRPSHSHGHAGRDSSKRIRLPSTDKTRVRVDTFCPSLDQLSGGAAAATTNGRTDPKADLDSCWIAGFLHHEEIEREREVAKLKSKILLLPGGGLPPPNSNLKKDAGDDATEIKTTRKSYAFTEDDERRLLEVQKRLMMNQQQQQQQQQQTRAKTKIKANTKGGKRTIPSPYLPVKKHALKSKKLIQRGHRMRSTHLEAYFEINRAEMEASIIIQCFWRSILASRRLHEEIQRRMAIVTIQKTIRGCIARCWVRAWKRKRDYYIVRCQARIRQITSSRWWNKTLGMECICATMIQKTIRMFLVRCQVVEHERNMAANSIQTMFHRRKLRQQKRYEKERMAVVAIQRIVRGVLGRSLVSALSIEMNRASLDIQKFWRGHLARLRRTQILRERFAQLCGNSILVINAEIGHYEYELDKLEKAWNVVAGEALKEKEEDALRQSLEETQSNLVTSEENTRELLQAKAQMTPMSVSEGWEEEVDNSLKHERIIMTKMKLDAVLDLRRKIARQEQRGKEFERSRAELEKRIEELKAQRAFLRNNHRVGDSQQKLQRDRRAKAADERRRWKVQHRTPSGKPFKGKNSVVTSSQFCSGNVNLFAATKDPSTERLINMIELQGFLKQVRQFDRLLRPMDSILKK